MNYTENYHLPQWEETDRIMRTDFNEAMANIEGGITNLATSCSVGVYSGTGEWQKITTGFRPRMLFVHQIKSPTHDFLDHRALSVAFGERPDIGSVTYEDDGFNVYGNGKLYPPVNNSGQNYIYFAFR